MAHETLKTLITQNIKTNGRNAITAQILQDVLLAMVDECPDITGYATRSWVTSQGYITASALTGYATQSWVTSQLGNYLPLDGGTMTGSIVAGNLSEGMYTLSHSEISFDYSYNGDSRYMQSLEIGKFSDVLAISFTGRNGAVQGTLINGSSVTSDSFIKQNGTAAQFLKADGSVDSNTYITASALTGYATQSWVTTQLGGYLPLTGGTLTGDLFTTLHKIISITLSEGARRNTYINLGYQQVDGVEYAMNMNVSSSLVPLAGLDLNGVFIGSGYKVTDGTSDEVLCADGSVKTLSELKAALDAL